MVASHLPRADEDSRLPSEGNFQLRRIRDSLLVGLTVLFLAAMLVVAPLGEPARLTPVFLLRLVTAAVLMPLIGAVLARRVLSPVRELSEAHDRLRRMYDQARVDGLLDPISGLGNHRAFQEELERQIDAARLTGLPVAVALLDLDDLKRINDDHGHAAGDEVLAAMGRLISVASRTADYGFRVGSDEFAIVMPGADAGAASAVAKRMLAMAVSGETPRRGSEPFSFSAGVSAFPYPSSDAHALVRQADAALYWAKRHGRTDVQLFDPERHGAADDQRSTPELAQAVSDVARHKLVTPLYQPIFDLMTGRPVGYEGLVRPAHGSGFRNAQSLFLAAEAAERTIELDLVCLDVVAQGARLPRGGQYLALNLSPRTMETDQFQVADLRRILRPHRIKPERVVLELTEREAIEDFDRLRDNIERCRAAGMRIAADDVGAGNAGLRLLSEIRFDIVKIDLLLVQGGVLRESAMSVLRAIRDIGAQSGATIVAEGVETADQLEAVRSLGMFAGQGYLLAPPAETITSEKLNLDALVQAHRARRSWLADSDMAVA